MTTDGTEYLVRCWAYSRDRQRCEQLAGHDGDHAVVSSWTDEECFNPAEEKPLTAVEYGITVPAHYYSEPEEAYDSGCLVCDHPMHKGMCRVGDCDCKNGIPK